MTTFALSKVLRKETNVKITRIEAQAIDDDEGNVVYLVKSVSGFWVLLWPDDESANSSSYAVVYGIARLRLDRLRRIGKAARGD